MQFFLPQLQILGGLADPHDPAFPSR